MGKFTSGLLAGGLVGAIGLGYALRDRRFRKKMLKDGRRIVHRCSNMFDNVTDMF
jgi:hypothetical protein